MEEEKEVTKDAFKGEKRELVQVQHVAEGETRLRGGTDIYSI